MRILGSTLNGLAGLSVVISGCGSWMGGVPSVPPPPQPAAHVAPASRPADMPRYVERRAEAAFVARRLPADRRADYIASFQSGYRDAVTSPAASMWADQGDGKPDVAYADGVAAGKIDAPLPIEDYVALFEARGYTRQTVTGNYSNGFEESSLKIGSQPGGWWLTPTPYSGQSPKRGPLIVTGLVSPEGADGHLNGYRREILVLEMRRTP